MTKARLALAISAVIWAGCTDGKPDPPPDESSELDAGDDAGAWRNQSVNGLPFGISHWVEPRRCEDGADYVSSISIVLSDYNIRAHQARYADCLIEANTTELHIELMRVGEEPELPATGVLTYPAADGSLWAYVMRYDSRCELELEDVESGTLEILLIGDDGVWGSIDLEMPDGEKLRGRFEVHRSLLIEQLMGAATCEDTPTCRDDLLTCNESDGDAS